MFTVANRIKVKKGFGAKLAPAFVSGKELTTFEGFNKVEVNLSEQHADFDELNVVMYWDTLEQFQVWKESDAFKKAHSRGGEGHGHGGESPVLSNEIVIAEVVAELVG